MKQLKPNYAGDWRWSFVFLLVLALAGCRLNSWQASPIQPTLPFKVKGAKDRSVIALQSRLEQSGVQVINLGQDYLLSIQSNALFPNESPQLTWGSYALLNDVVCFLKQFRKIAINVTAFSDKCVSVKREQALTLARARVIGNYLWSQGIDSRLIFTQGLGSEKPIKTHTKGGDNSPNSRIEITFRDAVA